MAKKLKNVIPLCEIEEYVNKFTQPNNMKYQNADWLQSDYNDSVWIIVSENTLTINWSIRLENGDLLTLPKHERLLKTLKSWLIVQTHSDLTKGHTYSPRSLSARLTRVLYCIDYFLLRSKSFNLHEYGLDAITNNQIKELIAKLGQGYVVSEGIYEFQSIFINFLKSQTAKTSSFELKSIIQDNPWLCSELNDVHIQDASMSKSEIILARAWLLKNDLYNQSLTYKYDLDVSQVTKYLYANTLLGSRIKFIVPSWLKIGFLNDYKAEYPAVKVVSEFDKRMSSKEHSRLISTLCSLNLVLIANESKSVLDENLISAFQSSLNLKLPGRFKTLPHSVFNQSLCSAIEYILNNGDHIVDSYLRVVHEFVFSGSSTYDFIGSTDIRDFLHKRSLKFGINRWKIVTNVDLLRDTSLANIDNYYDALRMNLGLYESLRVLYGAIQIIIGSLSAQRSGSLLDLIAGQCLDSTKTRLVFYNRKSGHSGLNQRISRPIPSIAVRCIEMIERLQKGLLKLGLLDNPTNLFAYPQINTLLPSRKFAFNQYTDSFDYFCDWAQLPLNPEGQRYYIRNHQLRRHFAMLFFWGNGYGGMDPLRWFLGHTDVEHLWHYITEITPGYTLRSIAAEWGAQAVINGSLEVNVLNSELTKHFGTNDFSVIESDVLQSYLEELMTVNRLVIAPQFLDGGKSYKIGVVLKSIEDVGL